MVSVRYNPRPVRRLLRILLNALTVLSLILLVAIIVLWAAGYSSNVLLSRGATAP
jgi:hypothetical protein